MSKRHSLLFMIGLFLALLMAQPAAAQTRSVFWEVWNVEIDNVDTAGNAFDVREIYNVHFSGTFRFGQRVLEANNLDSYDNIQVYEAGQALERSCSENPGTFCVQNVQEGVSVTYYFRQPITNASQNFEIHYTAHGALRIYEGGDQLWWTAIPSDHFGFSIGRARVTVQLPPGFAPREDADRVATYGVPTEVIVEGTKVTAIATRQINGDEQLEIRVQYPHDPTASTPSWQSSFDRRREFEETVKPVLDLGLIALAALFAIGGPLGAYTLWYRRGRDPEVGPVPEYLSEPPSDLPPAVVGTLTDEKADVRDVLSTLIDLGRRGYLVIEEGRSEGLFGLGGGSEFTFKRTDKSLDELRPFERKVFNKVFTSGRLERALDDLKNKFYRYIPDLQDDLYDELVSKGLFTSKPSSTRSLYNAFGVGTVFIAFVLGFFLVSRLEEVTSTVICLPLALGIVAGAIMIIGQHMPAKTRKGAEEAAKWKAFHEYLRNLDKYAKVEDVTEQFDRYMPYAVAFGLDRSWIRRFARVDTIPIPTWYYPTYRGGRYGRGYHAGTPLSRNLGGGGLPSASDVAPGELARAGGGGGASLDTLATDISGGLESISDGLTDMLNSASRTLNSKPSSSDSSGGWGGGGWSGGGSGGGGSSGGGSSGFG